MRHAATLPRRQHGVTLIMALLFLLVMSMIGVMAARNNVLQEHMAGSTRSRELALQAAEAALKDAEQTLPNWRTLPFDGSQPGLSTYDATIANDAAYWQDASRWVNYRLPQTALNQVVEQPRYRVEKMPVVGSEERYRVTARGVGREASAVVVLQTMLGYTP
jgi:type IV pilus assembly protein PilX